MSFLTGLSAQWPGLSVGRRQVWSPSALFSYGRIIRLHLPTCQLCFSQHHFSWIKKFRQSHSNCFPSRPRRGFSPLPRCGILEQKQDRKGPGKWLGWTGTPWSRPAWAVSGAPWRMGGITWCSAKAAGTRRSCSWARAPGRTRTYRASPLWAGRASCWTTCWSSSTWTGRKTCTSPTSSNAVRPTTGTP